MRKPDRDWVLVENVDDANPWRDSLLGEQFAAWGRDRNYGLAVLLDHDGSTRPRGPRAVTVEGDRLRVLIGGTDLSVILRDLRLVPDFALARWFGPSLILDRIEHAASNRGARGCAGDMQIPIRLDPEQVVHGSVDLSQVPARWRGRRLRAVATTHDHVWAMSRPLTLARRPVDAPAGARTA